LLERRRIREMRQPLLPLGAQNLIWLKSEELLVTRDFQNELGDGIEIGAHFFYGGSHPEGVTLKSPGSRSAPWERGAIGDSKYPEGVAQSGDSALVQPLRGRKTTPNTSSYPGCAARPWAFECDPFGVGSMLKA